MGSKKRIKKEDALIAEAFINVITENTMDEEPDNSITDELMCVFRSKHSRK